MSKQITWKMSTGDMLIYACGSLLYLDWETRPLKGRHYVYDKDGDPRLRYCFTDRGHWVDFDDDDQASIVEDQLGEWIEDYGREPIYGLILRKMRPLKEPLKVSRFWSKVPSEIDEDYMLISTTTIPDYGYSGERVDYIIPAGMPVIMKHKGLDIGEVLVTGGGLARAEVCD
jgi:hypothetical protein